MKTILCIAVIALGAAIIYLIVLGSKPNLLHNEANLPKVTSLKGHKANVTTPVNPGAGYGALRGSWDDMTLDLSMKANGRSA